MNNRRTVIIWTVGEHRYAFPLEAVTEIVRPLWVTPVPEAPAHMLGVIQVRQAVVPVFDLRARFGAEPSPFVYRNRFIVASAGGRLLAFVVEEVIEIVDIGDDEMHGPAAFPSATLPAVVASLFTLQGHVVALLDVAAAIAAPDLTRVDAAIQELEASKGTS